MAVVQHPCKILAAEDVKINRDILAALLGRAGHTVHFAEDGAQALGAVQREPFDIVLMDVQMPVMDGMEATRRIRALSTSASRVPIIGLTANATAQDQAACLAAGMDECLPKPIDWAQLSDTLSRHAPGGAPRTPPAAHEQAAADERGILDLKRVESIAMISPADSGRGVLLGVLSTAQDGVAQLVAAREPATAGALAHKLVGSVGTVGFAALAVRARRREASARAGRLDTQAIGELPEVLEATRQAVHRLGSR
jgi:CheY-like chemotaxis protein